MQLCLILQTCYDKVEQPNSNTAKSEANLSNAIKASQLDKGRLGNEKGGMKTIPSEQKSKQTPKSRTTEKR